jgi:hypothetical protein
MAFLCGLFAPLSCSKIGGMFKKNKTKVQPAVMIIVSLAFL